MSRSPHDQRIAVLGDRAVTTQAYRQVAGLDVNTLFELPVTEKAAVRSRVAAYYTSLAHGAELRFRTSGTTGAPMRVPRTSNEAIGNIIAVADGLRPVVADDPRCLSTLDSNTSAAAHLVAGVRGRIGGPFEIHFPYRPAGSPDYRELARTFESLRPTEVIAAPGVLDDIESALRRIGLFEKCSNSVEVVSLMGETSTRAKRSRQARAWGARVYSALYGSTETQTIAASCANDNLHVFNDRFVLEVRDADGIHPLIPTRSGELIVTPLYTEAMVLLRYAMGDRIEAFSCPCGNGAAAISVVGRQDDVVITSSGPTDPDGIDDVIYFSDDVLDYRLGMDADDRVALVQVELADRHGRFDPTRIEDGLGARVEVVRRTPIACRTGALVKSWRQARTYRLEESS